MVPTCKNVALYSPTPLNVGTMFNAPLCSSLYLFRPFMPSLHLECFCRKFLLCQVSALFMEHEIRCTITSYSYINFLV